MSDFNHWGISVITGSIVGFLYLLLPDEYNLLRIVFIAVTTPVMSMLPVTGDYAQLTNMVFFIRDIFLYVIDILPGLMAFGIVYRYLGD